jgi:RNA polymerase sigma-70 factor (ECF subfamily)
MEHLVRRAVDGDASAFEELMRETSGSVRTVVRSYVKQPEDARDVVQEVYLRALQRLSSLDDPERFKPWLYAIARNAGLDYVRSSKRRPVSNAGFGTEEMGPIDIVDLEPGPEQLAEVRELSRQVQIGMGRLSPRDATLLAMVTTLGFTPTDVAGALGMTPTAAKVAIHRARQRLRNAMLLASALQDASVPVPAKGPDCSAFGELVDGGSLVEAAIHARGCPACGKPRLSEPLESSRH